MPFSPGAWHDIDPSTATFPAPDLAAFATEDGGLEITGAVRQWQVFLELEAPVSGPGRIGVRGSITVNRGSLLVALYSEAGAVLHQFRHDGRAGPEFESHCDLDLPVAHVVLRDGSGGDSEIDMILHRLSLQQAQGEARPWSLDAMAAPVSMPLPPDIPHHPALAAVIPWRGLNPSGFSVNWVGTRTDARFIKGFALPPPGMAEPPLPEVSEEYFEWICAAEAIAQARGRFTMVELGAGYGRWMMDALGLIRQLRRDDLTPHFIGVEAEPTHFDWMAQHLRNNGLDPAAHRLVQGAVAGRDGKVRFAIGNADAWYGQSIVTDATTGLASIEVPAWSLTTLLHDVPMVDLIDIDIQGAEAEVCEAAARVIDEKVRRIYIGTHGVAIEHSLRALFRKLGWRNLVDYRMGRAQTTPFGRIMFGDGVQCWLNPRL